MITNKVVKHI
jgi:aldehyde dehydrogenase (NAD+)